MIYGVTYEFYVVKFVAKPVSTNINIYYIYSIPRNYVSLVKISYLSGIRFALNVNWIFKETV